MAEQLSLKLRRKGKNGRTVKGRIKKGFYLSCSGNMGKAKPKRRRKASPRRRRR